MAVFLTGKSHEQRSLAGYSPLVQRVKQDLATSVVQSPSRVRLFATPWNAACLASLSLTTSQSLPKFMSIATVMPFSHLIL